MGCDLNFGNTLFHLGFYLMWSGHKFGLPDLSSAVVLVCTNIVNGFKHYFA